MWRKYRLLRHTNISNLMVACRTDMNVTAEIKTQNRPGGALLILVSLCKISRLEWDPVWSSAAVAHLLQGLKRDVFREALLHDLIVTSGYLSYCCLPITCRQSGHFPLSSNINKAFSPRELLLTSQILCKP